MLDEDIYKEALRSILQKEFREVFRSIMLEEFQAVVREFTKTQELPPLLTRTEMMALLRISSWKATELMGRPDFPVMREAGLLIPTDKLFLWIDRHTQWVEEETDYFNLEK